MTATLLKQLDVLPRLGVAFLGGPIVCQGSQMTSDQDKFSDCQCALQVYTSLQEMSSYAYVSLSLIGLCALAGAGVGVGSGVAMMYSQMAQAEQEQKTTGAVAHSPGEPFAPAQHHDGIYLPGHDLPVVKFASPLICVHHSFVNSMCCAVERKSMAASRGFAAAGARSQ